MSLIKKYIIIITIFLVPFLACSQPSDTRIKSDKWVCTWATAQQFDDVVFRNSLAGYRENRNAYRSDQIKKNWSIRHFEQ
jgi:hypothetical protein